MSNLTMYGSMFLIGTALALGGGMGVFLPPGYRSGVLLALLAGAGVGIAGLAVGWAFLSDGASVEDSDWWRVFFVSTVAGFATVAAGLAVAPPASHVRVEQNRRIASVAGPEHDSRRRRWRWWNRKASGHPSTASGRADVGPAVLRSIRSPPR